MERFKTLKDHVYEYIAAQIREGNLIPDQRINENIICEELNISRTPVREALIQLSAEGILENKARRGFLIRSISEKDVRELYSVIGILDGYAANLACNALTEQDYADLSFYIEAMDLAIRSGNYDMYHKQQVSFHQLYIDKCGNNALIDTIAKSKNKLLKKTYSEATHQDAKKVLHATNDEHREILRLFQTKDKEGLFRFLSQTHWTPAYASYDVMK
ncbi:GntR family transcriptional regulator [Ihubacter sp. mB4P-1]|uniref:GntR family transcriptional regulator n=1 Tax=Ihubacter sp. mB4P-1 TaxID=3242370 RepID=UPI003C7A7679